MSRRNCDRDNRTVSLRRYEEDRGLPERKQPWFDISGFEPEGRLAARVRGRKFVRLP